MGAASNLKPTRAFAGVPMTVGGLNFNCPKCNNPLFFTFKLASEGDSMVRTVHCPGCRTAWGVKLDIRPTRE
jgi:DNA-directed RNA polymerase subunit M/transcription elongation factor TFIIS